MVGNIHVLATCIASFIPCEVLHECVKTAKVDARFLFMRHHTIKLAGREPGCKLPLSLCASFCPYLPFSCLVFAILFLRFQHYVCNELLFCMYRFCCICLLECDKDSLQRFGEYVNTSAQMVY